MKIVVEVVEQRICANGRCASTWPSIVAVQSPLSATGRTGDFNQRAVVDSIIKLLASIVIMHQRVHRKVKYSKACAEVWWMFFSGLHFTA